MVYKLALFSNLLLASVATMAVPSSQLGARLARGEGLQSQPSNRNVSESNEAPDSSVSNAPRTKYTKNWAGVQVARDDIPFMIVTAHFTVPAVSPIGADRVSGVLIWVGVGAGSSTQEPSCDNLFLSGVRISITDGVVMYNALWQWYPDKAHNFAVAAIRPGDDISLTVELRSVITGEAVVKNLTRGWIMKQTVESTFALCNQYAGWMVESFIDNSVGTFVPFPKFGSVAFRESSASRPGSNCNGPNKPACNVVDATQMYDIFRNIRFTYTIVTELGGPILTINDRSNY